MKLKFLRFKRLDFGWGIKYDAVFWDIENDKKVCLNRTELLKVVNLKYNSIYEIERHKDFFYPIKVIVPNGIEYLIKFNKIWKHIGNEYMFINTNPINRNERFTFQVIVSDKVILTLHTEHLNVKSAWNSFREYWIKDPEILPYKKFMKVKIKNKLNETIEEHQYQTKCFVKTFKK